MADVVTRLVVESKEYDSKIARATQGLTQFEKKCREAGGTLEFVEKEDLEFVKALGQMETVSSSATGKLGELKKAFTELSVQYKNLTDAEKQSPYGQALAGSLDQIKGRIGELGGQLSEVGKEMNGSKSFVDGFTDALGSLGPAGQTAAKLLKGAFGPVGIAIAAVVGIIHQVVEAFKRNEDAMASAERAAAPFKAVWQGIQRIFDKLVPLIADGIEKISNGVQSLFGKLTDWMGRLSQTSLGKKLGLDTVYEQMKKVSSVTGELIEDNKKIADSERALEEQRRRTKEGNAVSSNKISNLRYKASDKSTYSADERVAFLDEAMKEEEKILKRNLDLRQKEYDLIKLKNSLTASGTEDLNEQTDAFVALQQAEQQYNEGMRSLQKQRQAAVNEAVKDSGSAESPAADGSIAASNVKDAAAMWGEYTKKLEETKARLAEFKAMVEDMNLSQDQRDWAQGMADAYQEQLDKMTGATQEAVDEMKTKVEELPSSFEMMRESLSNLSSGVGAISTIGNAFNELKGIGEDLTAAFSGEMDAWDSLMTVFNSGISIMQTVIGVMEAINTLTELSNTLSDVKVAKQEAETIAVVGGKGAEATATAAEASVSAGELGVDTADAAAKAGKAVAWIPIVGPALAAAAIAAIVAAIMGAQSKAKSAGNFATGGLIPGSSFSGDNLTANVNSGELILNRAQQESVAAQLQGGAVQTVNVQGILSGSNIILAVKNRQNEIGIGTAGQIGGW